MPPTTLSGILKNQQTIVGIEDIEIYWNRKAKYLELESCLIMWFNQRVNFGITKVAEELTKKAYDFGILLDIKDFKFLIKNGYKLICMIRFGPIRSVCHVGHRSISTHLFGTIRKYYK